MSDILYFCFNLIILPNFYFYHIIINYNVKSVHEVFTKKLFNNDDCYLLNVTKDYSNLGYHHFVLM